jgi:hypothetical protein
MTAALRSQERRVAVIHLVARFCRKERPAPRQPSKPAPIPPTCCSAEKPRRCRSCDRGAPSLCISCVQLTIGESRQRRSYFDFPWGEAQVICHRVQSEELKCSVASNLPLIRLSEPHAEYSYLISYSDCPLIRFFSATSLVVLKTYSVSEIFKLVHALTNFAEQLDFAEIGNRPIGTASAMFIVPTSRRFNGAPRGIDRN